MVVVGWQLPKMEARTSIQIHREQVPGQCNTNGFRCKSLSTKDSARRSSFESPRKSISSDDWSAMPHTALPACSRSIQDRWMAATDDFLAVTSRSCNPMKTALEEYLDDLLQVNQNASLCRPVQLSITSTS